MLSDWRVSSQTRLPISTPSHKPEAITVSESQWGLCEISVDCHDTWQMTWQQRDNIVTHFRRLWPQIIMRAWVLVAGGMSIKSSRVLITVDNARLTGSMRNLKSSNFPLNCFHNNRRREKSLSFAFVLELQFAQYDDHFVCVMSFCNTQNTKY